MPSLVAAPVCETVQAARAAGPPAAGFVLTASVAMTMKARAEPVTSGVAEKPFLRLSTISRSMQVPSTRRRIYRIAVEDTMIRFRGYAIVVFHNNRDTSGSNVWIDCSTHASPIQVVMKPHEEGSAS